MSTKGRGGWLTLFAAVLLAGSADAGCSKRRGSPPARSAKRPPNRPPKRATPPVVAKGPPPLVSIDAPCKPVACARCGQKIKGRGTVVATDVFGDYEIRLFQADVMPRPYPRLEILHKGRSVFLDDQTNWNYGSKFIADSDTTCAAVAESVQMLKSLRKNKRLTTVQNDDLHSLERSLATARWMRIGADFTGNGVPNFVVVNIGLPMEATLFELGHKLVKVATVELGINGADEGFVDLDGDGFPEIEGCDSVLQGWKDSVHTAPLFIPAVFKWQGGRYQLHAPAMRKPPLSKRALARLVRRARTHKRWSRLGVSADLWGVMARLIYAGNAKQARQFLRLIWPKGINQREFSDGDPLGQKHRHTRAEFWRLFVAELRKSKFFADVLKLNGGRL